MLSGFSEGAAQTYLARGLTTKLIIEAAAQEPTPDFVLEAFSKKTGRNLIALGRVAARLRRHPGCIYATAEEHEKRLFLSLVVRSAFRDSRLRYVAAADGFEQDLLRYIHRTVEISNGQATDSILVLTRHTIQRWIERRGAGDPRVELLSKIDRSVLLALTSCDLFTQARHISRYDLRDRKGQSARFGVPDRNGGIWVSALSGFSDESTSGQNKGQVQHGALVSFLTYLAASQLSDEQHIYRDHALEFGLLSAARSYSNQFIPKEER